MKVLTAEQMVSVDRETIARGTPGIVLMRNAGEAVFRVAMSRIESGDTVAVIAGKGNNGGDGFRVAELLASEGIDVRVFLVGERATVRGDAKTCMEDFIGTGASIVEIADTKQIGEMSRELLTADVIVDALLGTGLSGAVKGIPALVIDSINETDGYVVAVDIPSGVNASTGSVDGSAVRADETVTFGCLKVGHILKPGALECGDIHIADIGFSDGIIDSVDCFAQTLIINEAASLLPERPFDAHKGSVGRVLVIAGSAGMTGAAALASESSLRVGAGVVTLGCPESMNDIFEVKLTEVMTRPLPEVRKKRCLSLRAMGMMRELAEKADVVAIGPGLGRYFETRDLIRRFVAGFAGRLLMDADAINAFVGEPELLRESKADIAITPHHGELARLLGRDTASIAAQPREVACEAAELTGAVVLLKGAPSFIAAPGKKVYINATGNEGMATAGSGDVLTGIVAGIAAQGAYLFDSAVLGAYVHGLAGDYAADDLSVPGMTAGNILDRIPAALSDIIGAQA